jgi:RimJ/RimL family protein N-acetyltransferase
MQVTSITLTGRHIRLVPLSMAHVPELTIAAQDETIWQYMLYGIVRTEQQMRELVAVLLLRQEQGTDLPFTVIDIVSNNAIGMTRYMDIQPENRSLEIGGTWYAAAFQRTAVNTEAKFLLLEHAFEKLGVLRVQFKTDLRNLRSQKALERIGAIKEGILRKHMITWSGYNRDSVYYSIIDTDWLGVRQHLLRLMQQNGG